MAQTASVTGVVFEDVNRDGAHQPGEPTWRHQLNLFTATGAFVASAASAEDGRYRFDDVPPGEYRLELEPTTYWALRDDWVPTTTETLRPRFDLTVSGSVTADFGWRRIQRSTHTSDPISSYVGPTGLRTESFNDVVTAREVHDTLTAHALVGEESAHVLIRFGLTPGSYATYDVSGTPGYYYRYAAELYVSYRSWVESGDEILTHEYGHGWSQYYAYLLHQDPQFTNYVQARGLDSDPRVGTSYEWDPAEMIAEDYRQLFGSPNARRAPQTNRDIPAASEVDGLEEFLRETYRNAPQPPSEEPAPSEPPAEEPEPILAVEDLQVNPAEVVTHAEITFAVVKASKATVVILDHRGRVVRTLWDGVTVSGSTHVWWDRRDDRGRQVKTGTYVVQVDVTDDDASASSAHPMEVVDPPTGGDGKGPKSK
jgi:hypothetical protein